MDAVQPHGVPPSDGPDAGEIAVMFGGAYHVNAFACAV